MGRVSGRSFFELFLFVLFSSCFYGVGHPLKFGPVAGDSSSGQQPKRVPAHPPTFCGDGIEHPLKFGPVAGDLPSGQQPNRVPGHPPIVGIVS